MPKFNPHPLFPENPLYEIHSEAEIPHSDRYELWCDGRRQTVYHTDSFDYAVVVRKNSEHFPVEIHVSTAFKDVVIRPLSVGISFERKEDVIRFTLPGPVKISVELDGNLKTPLFILTTNYVAPPDPAPAYFFRKGHVYNVGSLELKSGECAYLEEGSIVCGRIFSYKADCVSVLGNGILYGSVWHKPDENGGRLMAAFTLGDDIRIQGITIVDSGVWNLVPGACRNVSICDVNILSRLVTGDGIDIVGCENVTIENCFIRACDDCICIKACPLPSPAACCNVKNVHVHGCTLWNAEPGNALEIGYELRCNEVSDIVFSDCDIIHCEYEGNQSGGVLTIHNADRANVHNILYENIRIEDAQEKFVDIKILDSKYSLDRVRGISIHQLLSEKLSTYKAGASGLLALDWFNGVRTPLMDFNLNGLIMGMNLLTKPEEIYLSLIEATAYGTRMIIEGFEEAGLEVKDITLSGGIPIKNEMLVQVYSDVCNRKIKVVDSTQSSALGAAILGAAAAPERITGFKNANEAAKKLGKVKDKVWEPNQDNVEIYNELYEEYKTLHTYFGTGINDVMKHLNNIRERRK